MVEGRVNIFGVSIDSMSFDEAVRTLLDWIVRSERSRFVVTPNVNHLVLYQNDEAFRHAYRNASLVLPDGRYVILLSRILKRALSEPVNGSDLVPALLDAARRLGRLKVFLLGAMPGVADTAAARIQEQWPHVDIVGTYSPPQGFENDRNETREIISRICAVNPDLLVVGISPPKQEVWVSEHISDIGATVAICAGATIDFLAGEKPRAPSWMQRAGLEWVFRAVTEPRRLLPRYFKDGIAVIRLLSKELRRSRT